MRLGAVRLLKESPDSDLTSVARPSGQRYSAFRTLLAAEWRTRAHAV